MFVRPVVMVFCSLAFAVPVEAALVGEMVLVDTNLAIDHAEFSGNVDTYEFHITNIHLANITSLDLSFSGEFFTHADANEAFRASTGLPMIFGLEIPDSFFVVPDSGAILHADTVDSTTELTSSFTLPGDEILIPGCGHTTVAAFFTVPTGAGPPELLSGRAAFDGPVTDLVPLGAFLSPIECHLAFSENHQTKTFTVQALGPEPFQFGEPMIVDTDEHSDGMFSLIAPDLSDLPPGEQREFTVQFNTDTPMVGKQYTADLRFQRQDGEVTSTWALTANVVPEPSGVVLVGLGLAPLLITRRGAAVAGGAKLCWLGVLSPLRRPCWR